MLYSHMFLLPCTGVSRARLFIVLFGEGNGSREADQLVPVFG